MVKSNNQYASSSLPLQVSLPITYLGQNLSLHPHLHCIVPGGGMDQQGKWHKQVRSNKYLFTVKALSKVFRAKCLQQLRQSGIEDKVLLDSLLLKDWVVYTKKPFGGPKQVIAYLGRYTRRVAISNQLLQKVCDQKVHFSYKNYRSGSKQKIMSLTKEEFVRRFTQHILPHRFARIRYYGIISSTCIRGKLQDLQRNSHVVRPTLPVKTLLREWPCYKQGHLSPLNLL